MTDHRLELQPDWAARPMAGWAEFQEARRRFFTRIGVNEVQPPGPSTSEAATEPVLHRPPARRFGEQLPAAEQGKEPR